MGKINVLGFDVANLIAAGEVVDRPASVIKELVENSLDAGATNITVEIQHGGIAFIRVSDNGSGIAPDDLPVAILRHATSKIRVAEDLDSIVTLGFRGEALAAIASVSRLRILSRTAEEPMGAILTVTGGEDATLEEAGCAVGTTVIVEDLFFNVPARRKFLKRDATESAAVTALMEKLALSVPSVSFRYIVDGETKLRTAGDGNLRTVIFSLYGREVSDRLIAVGGELDGVRVSGYVSAPDCIRANRNMENFFINGRYIKSRTACAALEQAYATRIPAERFPVCVLLLDVNPVLVDVNVHPAKLEVKFSNERAVFESVYYAVMNALNSSPGVDAPKQESRQENKPPAFYTPPDLKFTPNTSSALPVITSGDGSSRQRSADDFWVTGDKARKALGAFVPVGEKGNIAPRTQEHIRRTGNEFPPQPPVPDSPDVPPATEEDAEQARGESIPTASHPAVTDPFPRETYTSGEEVSLTPQESAASVENVQPSSESRTDPRDRTPDFMILGEAYNCYVIVQLEDRLVLIDKHAAHERMIFDSLRANLHGAAHNAQILLIPVQITMTEPEIRALEDERDALRRIGFTFRRDKNGIVVSEIPSEISRESVEDMLTVLAGRLSDGTGTVSSTSQAFFEERLYQASCKAAIKGGLRYTPEALHAIAERLLREPGPGESAIRTCPHGRPVAFEIRRSSIERQFGRE